MQGPISRFRTAVAATAANLATAASRATGRGAGSMIGRLVAAARRQAQSNGALPVDVVVLPLEADHRTKHLQPQPVGAH